MKLYATICIYMFTSVFSSVACSEVYTFEEYEKYPQMLLSENFQKLSSDIEQLFEKTVEKKIDSGVIRSLLAAFNRYEEDAEDKLNRWVALNTSDPVSRMIRGVYYNHLAWLKRGHNFSNDTSKEQMDGLNLYQTKALDDFSFVIKTRPDYLFAYAYSINSMGSISGKSDDIRALYHKALEIDPANYAVRYQYLRFLTPRWGGSYAEMSREVNTIRPYLKETPKLNTLNGLIHLEKNREYVELEPAERIKHAPKRLKILNRALSYGEKPIYLWHKAYVLKDLNKINEAYKTITRVIELRPHDVTAYDLRIQLALMLRDVESIANDAEKLISLHYEAPKNNYVFGWALYGLGQHKKAISYLEASLKFKDNESYKMKAEKYLKKSQDVLAIAEKFNLKLHREGNRYIYK